MQMLDLLFYVVFRKFAEERYFFFFFFFQYISLIEYLLTELYSFL